MGIRYHVAVRRPGDDSVLVLADGSMPGFRAPAAPWQVVAPVVERMEADLGLTVVALRAAWLADEAADRLYEASFLRGRLPAGARWVGTDQLERRSTPLGRAIDAGVLDMDVGERQPWYRAGWYDDMVDWIDERLVATGLRRRGPIRQVRSWGRAALLEVSTDRGRLWAKQVPGRFAHEVSVTRLLADIDPGIVPPVLAADPMTGRMLMEHVEGPGLGSLPPESGAWDATVARLAEIQGVMARELQDLRVAGVPYARLSGLADRTPGLLVDRRLDQLGAWRGWTVAERATLEAATSDLVAACGSLGGSALARSIDHGDLAADQIIQGEMGPVFLDWSDSTVTHPFLAAAAFLDRLPVSAAPAERRLERGYLDAWAGLAPDRDLARELRMARIVLPLHIVQSALDLVLPTMDQPWEVAGRVTDAMRSLLVRLPNLEEASA